MPNVYCFGGPNGAGKTTLALKLLPALGVKHFVNADLIAKGLSPLDVSLAQLAAGRLMLQRLNELKQSGEDFGFESTFASNMATKFLDELSSKGWTTHLVFVWLSSAELAIERVEVRVESGGHFVEDETIRRRYNKGLQRLREYLGKEMNVTVFDNSGEAYEIVVRRKNGILRVMQPAIWREVNDAR